MNRDYKGKVLIQIDIPAYAGCYNACQTNPQCAAFTYNVNKACSLRSTYDAIPSSSTGIQTALKSCDGETFLQNLLFGMTNMAEERPSFLCPGK